MLFIDKIIKKNDDAIFLTNLYNDYSILSSGVYRNPNTMEGVSLINTLNLYKNEFYKLNALAGLSLMRDFNYNASGYNPGYSLSLENQGVVLSKITKFIFISAFFWKALQSPEWKVSLLEY